MQYSGDMEEMFKEFVKMFCQRKEETVEKICAAYDAEHWEDYTTFVHALKSTALSVGGRKLSEAAKALEMAGHVCCEGPESEKEKESISMERTLKIEGMMCPHCEARVKKALEGVSGIIEATSDHTTGKVVVKHDAPLDEEALRAAVTDAGYEFAGVATL